MRKGKKLVLASSSPRRRALLEELGLSFDIVPGDIEEDIRAGELPKEHCTRLAEEKAEIVAQKVKEGWVIGADTIVVIDDQILGKPSDEKEAKQMLDLLKGRFHTVFTGFCILNAATGIKTSKAVESRVKIKDLSEKEITDYIKTGEPFDKAGGYAIQGLGNFMVEKVEGSYTNVVGLPLEELKEALRELGIMNKVSKGKIQAS